MFASGVGGGTDDGSASTAVTLNLLPCIFHQKSLLILVQPNSFSEKNEPHQLMTCVPPE
jgi:hypothetical protein